MATSFDTTLAGLGIARTSSTTANAATASGSAALGQSDFLKLMTAQMQNQDPFNPVDNTQMVAQMAQISTTSGIAEMNTTLKAMATKLGVTTTSDALGFVGKTVLTEGNIAYGRTGGGLSGAIDLADAAGGVTVTISDATGAALKSLSLGPQAKGTVGYDWDGKTSAGTDAGTGPFTIRVDAQTNGSTVAAKNLVWAPVQSVSTTTGATVLTIPGIGEVPVSAVRQIG